MVTTPQESMLIVEDDDDLAVILKARLEAAGYSVHTERSGAGALLYALTHQPPLVILDIQLPDCSGYAVCEQLRSRYGSAELPVVMFTVMDQPDEAQRGFAAGANSYLSKHGDFSTLLQTVDAFLADPLPQ